MASTASQPGEVMTAPPPFFFLFFFQTFAERSCETCVTHRVEGVVQLIHYIDKAVEMPSELRVSQAHLTPAAVTRQIYRDSVCER